jgi:hypothetical protein
MNKQPSCKLCSKVLSLSKNNKTKAFCCDSHRVIYWQRIKRIQRNKKHRCIDCGIKIKPFIIYHARCPKHLKLNRSKK